MNGGELQPLGMIPTKASLATRVYMMATRFWGSLSSYKPINIYILVGGLEHVLFSISYMG
jgi:hypothetical protein